jgi:hypothetical protein
MTDATCEQLSKQITELNASIKDLIPLLTAEHLKTHSNLSRFQLDEALGYPMVSRGARYETR